MREMLRGGGFRLARLCQPGAGVCAQQRVLRIAPVVVAQQRGVDQRAGIFRRVVWRIAPDRRQRRAVIAAVRREAAERAEAPLHLAGQRVVALRQRHGDADLLLGRVQRVQPKEGILARQSARQRVGIGVRRLRCFGAQVGGVLRHQLAHRLGDPPGCQRQRQRVPLQQVVDAGDRIARQEGRIVRCVVFRQRGQPLLEQRRRFRYRQYIHAHLTARAQLQVADQPAQASRDQVAHPRRAQQEGRHLRLCPHVVQDEQRALFGKGGVEQRRARVQRRELLGGDAEQAAERDLFAERVARAVDLQPVDAIGEEAADVAVERQRRRQRRLANAAHAMHGNRLVVQRGAPRRRDDDRRIQPDFFL